MRLFPRGPKTRFLCHILTYRILTYRRRETLT